MACSHGVLLAQPTTPSRQEETMQFIFRPGNDTLYLQGNAEEFKRLYAFIDNNRAAISSGKIPVYVDGYCTSAPTEKENRRLASIRSNRVKAEMITRKGLLEQHFITQNHAALYQGKKEVVIVTFKQPASETGVAVLPAIEEKQEKEVVSVADLPPAEPAPTEPEPEPLPSTTSQDPRRLIDIRTNLLYDAFLSPTIGIEWYISPSLGIKVDASFAYWGNEHGRVHKLWVVSPEVRWYMGQARRLYLGVGGNIGEFNIYKGMVGGLVSGKTGYQGKVYGGGVTAGYLLKLSNRFSLDLNLGLGYTRFEYDTFGVSNEVRVYKGRNLKKNVWGPSQAGISLVWHFLN